MASKKKPSLVRNFLVTFLALATVATLAYAGLLSYYGKVVGEVQVSQSLVVEAYDSNNIKLANSEGGTSITFSASVVAGNSVTNGKIDNADIEYFAFNNRASVSAPIKVYVTGDVSSGEITYIAIVEDGTDLNNNNIINDEIDITSARDSTSAVPLTVPANTLARFHIKITWNIATAPGTYGVTLNVQPA